MEERGVEVDHSSLNRWVVKYAPLLDQAFPGAQASGGRQLANGRDLRADQGPLEVLCIGPSTRKGTQSISC